MPMRTRELSKHDSQLSSNPMRNRLFVKYGGDVIARDDRIDDGCKEMDYNVVGSLLYL